MITTHITAPPTSLGNHDSIDTAFDGDISNIAIAVSHKIDGMDTIGQPITGYLYTPEAYPHYTYLENNSGWNESLSSNEGRTSACAYRTKISQYGQGDSVCFNGTVFVAGEKENSTHFLANPAGSLFNGDMQAGHDGVYLNPYETVIQDNGYDIAGISTVLNMIRSNKTGAKSAFWGGARYQSIGTVAVDSVISATGKFNVGLDFALASTDFGATQAAVSLKAGQRIYFNNSSIASGNLEANWRSTVFNNDYIDYDSASSRLRIVIGNSPAATFHATEFANFVTGVNVGSGKVYAINGLQVVKARITGYTAMTGTVNSSTAYATSTITLSQLAARVNALQAALTSHGLIGA